MTEEEAYEFINKFPRCHGCDDSYPFGCDECDEAFYTALMALKEKEQEAVKPRVSSVEQRCGNL